MVVYTIEQAKKLLLSEKFKESLLVLDSLLSKNKNNDQLWYLRAIVSLKLRNYVAAHDCFDRALIIKRKPEYHKTNGMAYMEMYELEDAIEQFENAIELDKMDPSIFFYLSICYMFLNNPIGKIYIEKAYSINKKKTKDLINGFYSIFFKSDKFVDSKIKRELEEKIAGIPDSQILRK